MEEQSSSVRIVIMMGIAGEKPAITSPPSFRSSAYSLPSSDCALHLRHVGDQIEDAVRVSPLVVVPRQDLVHVRVDRARERRVEDRGVRVAVEVDGDELLVAVRQDVLQRSVRRVAQDLVDLVRARALSRSGTSGRRARRSASARGRRMPSNFPFSSGSTRPIAFAAPVVVGIIDSAAARPRRQSLCGRSRIS